MSVRPAHCPRTRLDDLTAGWASGQADARAIEGMTLDSRAVRPGWLYVALPGTRAHGAAFAEQATAAGAAAVLTDALGARLAGDAPVPVLVADDLRTSMGHMAARLFGRPAEKLHTMGITGTNGKTTTAFLTAAAFAPRRCGTVGTIGFALDGRDIDTDRTTVTTPESIDLQALLAVMVERGADAVAVEVSSHALELGRVAGMTFDQAAFINLGRDHLDFHHSMEAYFEAKARLFTSGLARAAVINTGDDAGAEIARRARLAGLAVTTVGAPDAQFRISGFRAVGPLETTSVLHTPDGEVELRLSMPGAYNALDGMIAYALAANAGCDPETVLEGLAAASVPGRMQRVALDGDDAPLVVVDFAHTPQAVAASLATFGSSRRNGRVIVVLGAGGDRDMAKRGPMGASAAAGADVVIVTDDNPRSEDPRDIRSAVLEGAAGHRHVIEVAGRDRAIRAALEIASGDDIIAVLGKGHEQGQILADRIVRFDDVEVVRQEWTALKEDS